MGVTAFDRGAMVAFDQWNAAWEKFREENGSPEPMSKECAILAGRFSEEYRPEKAECGGDLTARTRLDSR